MKVNTMMTIIVLVPICFDSRNSLSESTSFSFGFYFLAYSSMLSTLNCFWETIGASSTSFLESDSLVAQRTFMICVLECSVNYWCGSLIQSISFWMFYWWESFSSLLFYLLSSLLEFYFFRPVTCPQFYWLLCCYLAWVEDWFLDNLFSYSAFFSSLLPF